MKKLYQIRKVKTTGTFRGRSTLIEGNFENLKDAGQFLLDNSIELFSSNIALSSNKKALVDLSTANDFIVFEIGDSSIQDGDDLFEISSQTISF